MRTSEKTDSIDAAIEVIQHRVPFVDKTSEAKIEGRAYEFKYKYAPHDEVWERVRTHCAEQRVIVEQSVREGANATRWMTTRLTHVPSGQWKESEIPVEQAKPGLQNLGASLSYCRRVGLLCSLGIVAKGEDKDAVDDMAGREARPPRMDKAARSAAAPAEPIDVDQAIADIPRLESIPDLSKLWAAIKDRLPAPRKAEVYKIVQARTAEIKAAGSKREPGSDG